MKETTIGAITLRRNLIEGESILIADDGVCARWGMGEYNQASKHIYVTDRTGGDRLIDIDD